MTIQVVIADDHRMLRDALVMVLERQDDIKVAGQAEDGVEAIERCHALMSERGEVSGAALAREVLARHQPPAPPAGPSSGS